MKHIPDIDRSNSLTVLAARVRGYHEAIKDVLKRSVEYAMDAGDLLIEAKEQLDHGQWLPWLREHCRVSKRTAQLYMNLAKHRAIIEKEMAKSATVAHLDLTLNEAAALCVLAGRLERLMDFAKRAEGISGNDLVNLCIERGFDVIVDKEYDPFFGRSKEEKRDWLLFALFIGDLEFKHVEWLLQGGSDMERQRRGNGPSPFQNPDRWLGEPGSKWRKCCPSWKIGPKFIKAWEAHRAENAHKTLKEVEAECLAAQKGAGVCGMK